MSVKAKFMSTSGKFRVLQEHEFPNTQAAFEAVKAHYIKEGFSDFKLVDDQNYDSLRVTAKTPGGRHGRNVGFIEYDYNMEDT